MENPNPRPRFDYHNPRSRAGQKFLRWYRPICHAFGFQKGYNFPFYVITIGALMGFVLSRFEYMNITGIFFKKTIPGEVFWYQEGPRRIGITLHLVSIFWGAFFACLQFTPVIRHKFLWFHRICGYLSIILFLLSNAGAFMIMDHAVGGTPLMRIWIGLVGTMTIIAITLAYVNVKRLQIDQHRAWMIRTWAWTASIISLRLIQMAGIYVVKHYHWTLWAPLECREIHFMYSFIAGIPDAQNPTGLLYSACSNRPQFSQVAVAVSNNGSGPENSAVNFRNIFPMAAWLAVAIHAILAELYLWLTPEESYRLRLYSYKRQVEKGIRKQGEYKPAGTGASRCGNAPKWWSVPMEDYMLAQSFNENNLKNESAMDEEAVKQMPPPVRREGSDDSDATLNGVKQQAQQK